ncbi:MAG: ABC transporter substrate-binding protein [Clostridiales bacterium]|nr:ABC transporter substrate-binding protein [Clostridiales bacterium]
MKRVFAVIISVIMLLAPLSGCRKAPSPGGLGNGMEPSGREELSYAHEFSVDHYDGGLKLITINEGGRFLVVPEGAEVPKNLAGDIAVLKQPVKNIYLAATAVMCLFDGLERLDAIRLSGTKADGWYVESARLAMENGDILYAGKYSQPDYELILRENCALAIESGMIGHASDVKAQLEKLGVPVLVDRSSYETHPLGRTEWIKLYGVILGCEEKAEALFNEQVRLMNSVSGADTGKTVAFFRISGTGYAVARKSGDYVSRMIELAGGRYAFTDLGDDSAMATVNVEMETFFKTARSADIVIYNSTIGGEISSLDEFLALNPLMGELNAVRNGAVWCTRESMYQQTLNIGLMISEIHTILTCGPDDEPQLKYFFRLK